LTLIDSLKEYYGFKNKKIKKTPALMLQGTTSNAGKSILTTAICRILYQDGLKVYPFKSQNMALNSFVTPDGGEIGRAQAVQAQACGQDPSILMNPILLKPNCDIGSQVIINGKPISHMNFRDYFKFKPKAFGEVKKAYDEISSESDVMVIEGAGSPSEVNLKQNDIVNMNMAKYANADVYITSDIDRGGMFASFLGTFDTLSEWERDLVKGLIINRFRGDKSLLDSGMDYLKRYTHVPVIGCVPFIKGHNIPEEDCLEFKSGMLDDRSELGERLDIAVIDTPRISNFSDLDALKEEPDIRLRVVRDAKDFGTPDMILLCGSKSVMRDLSYLKESGLAKRIIDFHKKNQGLIVGICGGYQMLGKRILDPHHVESEIEFMEGLGLLDIETSLEEEKLLGQTKTSFIPFNQELIGYEIHHGKTRPLSSDVKEVVKGQIGFSNLNGSVWGSYLHGVFDEDPFRREFIDHLRILKGKRPLKKIVGHYNIERSIDQLASIVRESLDMDLIYKNLGL
ncbi:MAG: cobyric acid synthase, partial [Bdellovibrionales bacterium]|nr:cobyric acid synthase [Bdellovibrionales bacterium]